GIPGVGKSLFDKYLPYIVKGVSEAQVARVYPRADMSGAELTGKVVPMEKVLIRPDETEEIERYKAKVIALINPITGFVMIDDGQRVNPKALETTLKLVQDGTIEVYEDDKPVQVKGMRLIKVNYNDYGSMYSWPFPPHFAHRLGNGVEMGRGAKPGRVSEAAKAIIEDENDERAMSRNCEEQASEDTLNMLANVVRYVRLPDDAKKVLALAGAEISHTLRRKEVNLGDPRSVSQLKRTAKGLALSEGRTVVTPNDVLDAFEYGATAKYGATGAGEVATGLDDPDSIEFLVLDGARRIKSSVKTA
ncbi:MAG TPA: hypothetical protein VGF75_07110, partial [Candidatus Saccharimonadales bacterium]